MKTDKSSVLVRECNKALCGAHAFTVYTYSFLMIINAVLLAHANPLLKPCLHSRDSLRTIMERVA